MNPLAPNLAATTGADRYMPERTPAGVIPQPMTRSGREGQPSAEGLLHDVELPQGREGPLATPPWPSRWTATITPCPGATSVTEMEKAGEFRFSPPVSASAATPSAAPLLGPRDGKRRPAAAPMLAPLLSSWLTIGIHNVQRLREWGWPWIQPD